MERPYRIIISGEGGQGVLSIAKIMAYAAWQQGKKSLYVPYFSTEKRGGVAMAFAQIANEPIAFPKFHKADIAVALSQRAVDRILPYLHDDTVVITNSFLVKDTSALSKWNPHEINATKIAKEDLKKPRTFNMIIMGAMLHFAPGLEKEGFEKALEKTFHKKYEKDASLREMNEKAFSLGYDLIKQ